jgi:hypothetical protein
MQKTMLAIALVAIGSAISVQHMLLQIKNKHHAERVIAYHRSTQASLVNTAKTAHGSWDWKDLLHLLPLSGRSPDTTIVILNWSRFPNVVNITSVFCHPELANIVAEVFIWNNNPNQISIQV